MTKKVRFITVQTTKMFSTFFNQQSGLPSGQARTLGELFYSDPVLGTIGLFTRVVRCDQNVVTHRDRHEKKLLVTGANPYVYGLSLLQRMLKYRRRSRRRAAFPSWNRRRSLSVYGDYTGLDTVSQPQIISGYSSPAPAVLALIDVRMSMAKTATTPVAHCSFSDILRLYRSMIPLSGTYFQKDGGIIGGHSTFHAIKATQDTIRYQLTDIYFQSFPSQYRQACPSLFVTIRLLSNGEMSISLDGLSSVVLNNNPSLGKVKYTTGAESVSIIVSDGNDLVSRFMHWSLNYLFGTLYMNQFRPALYHTQGGALAKVLIDYGKNFENFLESPQLLDLFSQVHKIPKVAKAVQGYDWYGRLRWLTGILSGSTLAWNFSLKPTFDSLKALATNASLPILGEKEMSFETTDITSLPEGLQLLLNSRSDFYFDPANITYLKAVFRTQVSSAPDEAVLARAVMEHDPLTFLGLYPTPSGIWNSAKFTFILDWFVPIGRLIKDHQSYFQSPMLECRIGHTVHFEISTLDGLSYDLFWRSSFGERPTDPPGDSWLEATGLPSISIPLAVSMLLSGRRYEQ